MSNSLSSPSTAFTDFAAAVRRRTESCLERIFAERLRQAQALGPEMVALTGAIRDLTMRGGKRYRPLLVAAGFVASAPGCDWEPAVVAGAAFELMQTYFLIHDDWMDGDGTRRGGPAVHVALGDYFRSTQVGQSMAILAGDYANAMAFDLLFKAGKRGELMRPVFEWFARIQAETISGQVLDVAGAASAGDYRLEDLKTGSYSVRGPLVVGALLGDAPPALLDAIQKFAKPVGIAFQLRDDILGVFGDPGKLGKGVGADIRAGKRTSLIREAMNSLDHEARARLELALCAGPSISQATLEHATELVAMSGARARVTASIGGLVAEALEWLELSEACLSREGRVLLKEIALKIADRET